ncbi:hypothetical protein Aperf_G00000054761 [Anoplocephala perfoliata]
MSSRSYQSSMLIHTLLFCLTSTGHTTGSSAGIFTALTDIDQAVAAGRHLAIELTRHVNAEEVRLTKLNQLIRRLDSSLELTIGHMSTPSKNIFMTMADIDQTVSTGKSLSTELTSHISAEESRLTKLRQLIERLNSALEIYGTSDEGHSSGPVTQEEITTNPVSAFLFVLRLASNWSSELSAILELPDSVDTDAEALTGELDSRRSLFLRLKQYADMLPDDDDVLGALDAVIRLQRTYNIPAIDIAEGRILSSSSSPSLTDGQCMLLGQLFYEMGDYSHAIDWYSLVLDRIDEKRRTGKSEVGNDSVTHGTLYDYLSYAFGRSGRYNEGLEASMKLLEEDPLSQNGARSKAFYEMELMRLGGVDPPHVEDESKRTMDTELYIFENLCRQSDKWAPPDTNMSCRYSSPHSFFKLGPLKEETLLEDPPVLMFHDFITQNEVDHIIELAKPKLARAEVRSSVPGVHKVTPRRIAKSSAGYSADIRP